MRLVKAFKALLLSSYALLCLNLTPIAYATPFSDLSSTSPEIRACAAKIIRSQHLYKATSRDKWDKAIVELRVGQTAQDLLDFINRHALVKISPDFPFDQNAIYCFRLDDSWELECAINRRSKDALPLLTEFKIAEQPKQIFVAPPPNFTGVWWTYLINGEPIFQYFSKRKAEILF